MKRYWHHCLCLLALVAFVAGCAGLPAASFDRGAVLANLTDRVILPAHTALLGKAAALDAAALELRAAPDAAHLETLQQAWREAADAFARVEPFGFEGAMILHNQISKWPANVDRVEEFIAGPEPQALDAAFVESSGSTAKGLPVIEYLVFDPEAGDEAVLARLTEGEQHARRVDYLVALAANLHRKADELHRLWASDGGNLAGRFRDAALSDGEPQGPISMLSNELVGMVQHVVQEKIGKPLGKRTYGMAQPHEAEGWRSGHATALVRANIESVQRAFEGGPAGGDEPGLAEYLAYLDAQSEAEPLAPKISGQLAAALAALDALPASLERAVETNPAEVTAAYDAHYALLALLKIDMTNRLGVTITFNDSDGD
jgi:uncharacterized protein